MNRRIGILLVASLFAATGCASRSHQPSAAPTALRNGRSIYETGRDASGQQIAAQDRPLYSRCAACHRADGSGGLHLPDGAVSADIRRRALVTGQRHPYTLALLERAISTGTDNDGHPLNPVMPRWKLSRGDLHDVASYVLTKLK